MFVLDTDHLSLLQRGDSEGIRRLRERVPGTPGVVTTIVSFEEQTRGWLAYSARARSIPEVVDSYRRLATHLDDFRAMTVLDFDDAAADEFQRLRGTKIRIGTGDLRIAAIAITLGATVLTRNLADFRKVPGLKVEDWTT